MDFPIYQVPYLGNGMTIALDAVLHVFISHGVAIGMALMIALGEYLGYKNKSEDWEKFSRQLLKPVIIIITGVGAVTGIGIWFVTSALAPRGIGSMLRVFFWPWFIEWIVFTSEVVVILIYYFTWDYWKGRKKIRHIYLAFFYVLLATMSAFLITGILGFMLTSDGWPWDKSFWSAFFNPTFLPQLFVRLSFAVNLGVTFTVAYLLFSRRDENFRKRALSLFGKIAFVSLVLWGLTTWWYFHAVPSTFKTHAVFSVLTSHFSQLSSLFWVVNAFIALILMIFAVSCIGRIVNLSRALVVFAVILSCLFVTEFERIREFIRGPYLMPGYMYANQLLIKEQPLMDEKGLLDNSFLFNATNEKTDLDAQGLYLFGRNCSVCHTIGGINDIKDRLVGRSEDGIFVLIRNTQLMVPFMAPFSGTEKEQRIMANFLYRITNNEIKVGAPSRFISIKKEGGKHE